MDLLKPVKGGVITQTFAEHLDFQARNPEIVYDPGVDFYSENRNIYACDDGYIYKAGFQDGGFGNFIKIIHEWGISIYAHLAAVSPKKINQKVTKGDVIGVMGSTGFSTGVHLHFGCQDVNKNFFDPVQYFADDLKGQYFDLDETLCAGSKIKTCCDLGVNLRDAPVIGRIIQTLPCGISGKITGNLEIISGLPVYPVEMRITGYLCEYDSYGNRLFESEE